MAGILDFLFGGPAGDLDAMGNPVPRGNQRQAAVLNPPRVRNAQIPGGDNPGNLMLDVNPQGPAPQLDAPIMQQPAPVNDGNAIFNQEGQARAPAPVAPGIQMAAPGGIASANEDRTPTSPPQVASRSGDGPIMARFNPLPDAGPTINNAGILSNTRGPMGFQPISGGSPMTHSDGGLALMGYERAPNGNLRPLGISNGNSLMQVQDLADQARMNGPSFDLGSQAGIDAMNQFREGSVARAQGHIGSFMQNQLGQDTLGFQRQREFGLPGGAPGEAQTRALAGLAAWHQAQNSRTGEEAIRDATLENDLQRTARESNRSADEIADEWRRSNRPLPRARGGTGLTGNSSLPSWFGGPTTTPPPNQGGQIPGNVVNPNVAPTSGQNAVVPNVTPPPPASARGRLGYEDVVSEIMSLPARTPAQVLDEAFNRARPNVPRIPIPGSPTGERRMPTFEENPTAHSRAITEVLSGLDEPFIRANLPEIRNRLISNFAETPQNLDQWFNQSNNPLTRDRQQQAQIARIMAIQGISPTPINLNTDPRFASPWQRWIGSMFRGPEGFNRTPNSQRTD